MPWRARELSSGYTGLALACGHLDRCFPDCDWDRVAHQYLRAAFDGASFVNVSGPGLFQGLAGVAFVVDYLSRDGTRYASMLAAAERELIPETLGLCRRVALIENGCEFHLFDVISGLAGVGLYLLRRQAKLDPSVALHPVIDGIVALARRRSTPPAWHTPADRLPASMLELYPDGNLNCGMAHGLPGVLAFLSLCKISGYHARWSG
jgi:hypothetical protein